MPTSERQYKEGFSSTERGRESSRFGGWKTRGFDNTMNLISALVELPFETFLEIERRQS
jgi:hypothetical protein